jgi:glycosyltransferase involved in cell wall biosynthesis
MKKVVWYISKYFESKSDSTPGGRGWFLMSGLAKLGYKPVVITSDSNSLTAVPKISGGVLEQSIDGVVVIWVKTLKYNVAKSIYRILSWFHFEWKLLLLNKSEIPKPDVIVVSSLSLLTILNGLILKRKYKCRLIFEIRDIWPLTIVEEGGVSARNPLIIFLSFIERLGYRNSDAIVGTMPNLQQHVREVSGSTVPVHCVPMGVLKEQLEKSVPLESDYVDSYLSSDKLKVVHAGTIGITNALDVFFQAAEVLRENEGIEFIVVGDGPLKRDYLDKYGSLPNVVFAPKVFKSQVQSVLSRCDIVYFSTFPSKVWLYGQSLNKLIDYMFSGKPVLASYSGYPSMVTEAGSGSFVPSGDVVALVDELKRLASMPKAQRELMGQRGKEWLLTNRSYEELCRNYEKILFEGMLSD